MQLFYKVSRTGKGKCNMKWGPIIETKKILLESEENTNRADGGRPRKRPRQGSEDIFPREEPLSTLGGKARMQVPCLRKPSSSANRRYHHSHHHHRSESKEKEHMPEEFKNAKSSAFDGDVKKAEDAKAWLLGMKMFFQIHDYSENMETKVASYVMSQMG